MKDINNHAPWCVGPIKKEALNNMCPECPIDLRWWRAECECEARNFNPKKDCKVLGGKHESKWVHDYTQEGPLHLICTVCEFDGT